MPVNQYKRVIYIQRVIVVISILLFGIKIAAYGVTHSVSILSDALESIANIIASLFGLYSVTLAAKPRDDSHPYGHGKIEFISIGIEGTLIALSGMFIIYEAINRFVNPEPVTQLEWGMGLTLLAGVLNFLLSKWANRIGVKNGSLTLEGTAKHLMSDVYSSLGLIGSLALIYFTQWYWIDLIVAILFAVIIVVTGVRLLSKSIKGIMDEADIHLVKDLIARIDQNRPAQWIDLHNVRFIQVGSNLHFDAHLTLPWYFTVRQADHELHQFEALLKSYCTQPIDIFIHTDACQQFSCPICQIKDCPVRQAAFEGSITWALENSWENSKHRLGD